MPALLLELDDFKQIKGAEQGRMAQTFHKII